MYKLNQETKATFNFIDKIIKPKEADSKNSRKLLSDYLEWLPEHCEKHRCDLNKLEKLETTIWIDFDKSFTPERMNNSVEFQVNALTKWKADGKDEQILKISDTVVTKKNYLELGFPEMI